MRRYKIDDLAGVVVLTMTAAIVLVGCGRETNTARVRYVPPVVSDTPRDVVAASTPDTGPMPLDAYLVSQRQTIKISTARDVAAARCMRSLGYGRWTVPLIRTDQSPSGPVDSDLYDYLNPAEAATKGYPRVSPANATSSAPPDRQPTEAEKAAYHGSTTTSASGAVVPQGGCRKWAEDEVGADQTKLPVNVRVLRMQAQGRAMGDSRVVAALQQWASCMKERGFDYGAPVVARLDLRWASRAADMAASAEEMAVATADADCREFTRLIDLYKGVRRAHEEALVKTHREALEAAVAIINGWVEKAETVIAQG